MESSPVRSPRASSQEEEKRYRRSPSGSPAREREEPKDRSRSRDRGGDRRDRFDNRDRRGRDRSGERPERKSNPFTLYIGKLSHRTNEDDINSEFGKFGTVQSVNMKKGFCFVEFDNDESIQKAIAEMHERDFMGSRLIVEISGKNLN